MLLHGNTIQLGPWRVNGFSSATRATWLVWPTLDLVCDIGWCVDAAREQSRLLLSHFHDDHSAGLMAWVHWRQRASNTPTIYTHAAYADDLRTCLDVHSRLQRSPFICNVVALLEGDRVALDATRIMEVFETDHHVPTLGCMVWEVRTRLAPEWRGRPQDAIRKAVRSGMSVQETYEVPLWVYTSDTTPALFMRKPELLKAQVLVTECTYMDGVLRYDPSDTSTRGEREGITHTHIRPLARQLAKFEGECIALGHIAPRYSGCDVWAYLWPRLPPEQRHKLVVLPHDDRRPTLRATPSPQPDGLTTWGEAEPLLPEAWEMQKERPGPLGWKKARRLKEFAERWPGYRLGWRWGDRFLSEWEALAIYEDAYVAFLSDHPELVDWLVSTAADVYDTEPRNIASGLDYRAQDSGRANHFQDIAVRRALVRLGRWFEGEHLVEIRGERSEGYVLNPGVVPFHRPSMIIQPEWSSTWFLPGSIESFWQSNKVLLVPRS